MLRLVGFYSKWLLVLLVSSSIPLYLRLYTYFDMVLPYFHHPPTTYEVLDLLASYSQSHTWTRSCPTSTTRPQHTV